MRETLARTLALATGLMLALIAAGLAWQHNRPLPEMAVPEDALPTAPAAVPSAAQIERGRALYDELRCAACHAIAGVGNPRVPLDGVGDRLDAAALQHWIIADTAIEARLSLRVATAKARYRDLSAADLDALVVYLQSLPSDAGPDCGIMPP